MGEIDSKIVLLCYTYHFLTTPPSPHPTLSTFAVPDEVEEGVDGGDLLVLGAGAQLALDGGVPGVH